MVLWKIIGGKCVGTIQQLTSLERYWRAPVYEGVLQADEYIGKCQSSGKTTYGTFLKISKHELR
jgi:hypothetical protein